VAAAIGWERRTVALNRMLHMLMRTVGKTHDEDGQALVEYSLLLVLIAVVAIAAVRTFGLGVSTLFQSVVNVFP
jgi:Flp pilus assembly pilin Flp